MKLRLVLLTAALLVPTAVGAVADRAHDPAPNGPGAALAAAGADPVAVDTIVDRLEGTSLKAEVLELYGLVGAVPTASGVAGVDAFVDCVPEPAQPSTALLLASLNEAAQLRHAALAGVSADEIRFARSIGPGEELSTTDQHRLTAITSEIDLPQLSQAAAIVTEAVERTEPELSTLSSDASLSDLSCRDPLNLTRVAGTGDDRHDVSTTLAIDLGGNDNWTNNAGAVHPDVVIQALPGCSTTGGVDCTPLDEDRNGPALESVSGRECSAEAGEPTFTLLDTPGLVLDHAKEQSQQPSVPALTGFLTGDVPAHAGQAGDQARTDTGCLPQGASDAEDWTEDFVTRGIVSDGDEHVAALALDLAGDDRFAPDRTFNAMNNGNNAAGCDTRDMGEEGKLWDRNLTAGGAFTGIGILWDEDGADFYGGRSLTQGTGHVGAVGMLVDRGADPDEYSAVRIAQGAGLVAALGVLYDDGGADAYRLENDVPYFNEFEHFVGCDVSTRDGQGRANFNAGGWLIDEAGDDVYHVDSHDPSVPGASRDDPTTTEGSTGTRINVGPHPVDGLAALGLGLLYDGAGADEYKRADRADGTTDPRGVFVDR